MIVDRAQYWDHPGASQSKLKDFDRSPEIYFATHIAQTRKRETTEALRVGRALHALTLESDTFDERFPVFVGELRTKEAKAEFAALDAAAAKLDGCAIRDIQGDGKALADLRGMRDALYADRRSRALLEQVTDAELPVAWTDEESGVLCKARFDALTPTLVLDLKKTIDASEHAIRKTIATYGYHLQGAHYLAAAEAHTGTRPEAFALLFVEPEPPYAVNVCILGAGVVERAESRRRDLLTRLAECQRTGVYPGYSDTIWTVDDLPPWAA